MDLPHKMNFLKPACLKYIIMLSLNNYLITNVLFLFGTVSDPIPFTFSTPWEIEGAERVILIQPLY